MSNILTMTVERNFIERMNLAYGLIILIDLAEAFYEQGICLSVISIKHDLPLAKLEPIAARLEEAGLLGRHPKNQNKLILKKEPEGRWIFEIIPVLKNVFDTKQVPLNTYAT